ncbi:MAG: AraC family ligand binding domain-containing protein [Phormidesmis sp.]
MSIKIYSLSALSSFSSEFDQEDRPTRTSFWKNETLTLPAEGTHFGFVWQGDAQLKRVGQALSFPPAFPLSAGMFFSTAEATTIGGHDTAGMVVTQMTHSGQFLIGGPIESVGRFPYIDGGTTSLLIAPMAVGDPCLHALYMPSNVDQTMHSHPSDRIGIIIKGSGQCCDQKNCYDLAPGTLFHISPDHQHRFTTGSQGLDLVVFHPDSDMGFSDRNHPMLSRTLVDNIRATELPEIQTPL